MKAVAVFPGSQQVKIIEQDVPRLTQPDQVALRLLDVGICGTDKEICSFEYGTPPPGDDHLVIGHESLAEIVQVGSAVERFEVGAGIEKKQDDFVAEVMAQVKSFDPDPKK